MKVLLSFSSERRKYKISNAYIFVRRPWGGTACTARVGTPRKTKSNLIEKSRLA
jgi:hypothetical protein